MQQPPVSYKVEPLDAPRQRLSVAFRAILAIPHVLLVGGPGVGVGSFSSTRVGVLGALADICAVINWFAIIFTGRAIQGLMDLQLLYLRWKARALAYEALLRDEYPPFGDGDYPVTSQFTAVREGRNRWTVGLRLFLIIPQVIVLLVVVLAWAVTAVIGWFAVLITGRYPQGLWRFGEGTMRWMLRVEAYMLLLHDEYPPFSMKEEEPSPAGFPV